jgi:hypothetical protein
MSAREASSCFVMFRSSSSRSMFVNRIWLYTYWVIRMLCAAIFSR